MTLEELQTILANEFKEYEFKLGKRIYGRCLIAKKNKYAGADIYLKKDGALIEAAIPEMKTRLLIGSGAMLLKKFKKDYDEPCQRIVEFLNSQNIAVKVRT